MISTQATEYMKNKNITPNKTITSLADSLKSRDNLQDCTDGHDKVVHRTSRSDRQNITRVGSYGSLSSQRMSGISGPKCPTCGSTLEPGTSQFS